MIDIIMPDKKKGYLLTRSITDGLFKGNHFVFNCFKNGRLYKASHIKWDRNSEGFSFVRDSINNSLYRANILAPGGYLTFDEVVDLNGEKFSITYRRQTDGEKIGESRVEFTCLQGVLPGYSITAIVPVEGNITTLFSVGKRMWIYPILEHGYSKQLYGNIILTTNDILPFISWVRLSIDVRKHFAIEVSPIYGLFPYMSSVKGETFIHTEEYAVNRMKDIPFSDLIPMKASLYSGCKMQVLETAPNMSKHVVSNLGESVLVKDSLVPYFGACLSAINYRQDTFEVCELITQLLEGGKSDEVKTTTK